MRARPRIPPQFALISQAFAFLSFSRALGFGIVGAIPLTEVVVYHDLFPCGLNRCDFVEIIRLIDAEYLRTVNKPDDGSSPDTRNSNRPKRR